MSDSQLIIDLQKGSRDAFKRIYTEYYSLLIGVGVNITKDLDTAKEVTQEVFYQFWKNREKLSEKISIRNYLKRAVINRCLNHIKYNTRFVEGEILEENPSEMATPAQSMESKELTDFLREAIDRLPEKARIIFMLKREEGMSLKEIAEQLDISPKTVENQITRALKILRAEVSPHLEKFKQI